VTQWLPFALQETTWRIDSLGTQVETEGEDP